MNLQRAGPFVFSPKIAPAALATTQRVVAMVTEIETSFRAQTAGRLHEPVAQFTAQVEQGYPALARGLAAWPSIRPGVFQRAHDQVASIGDAARIDRLDVRAVPWLIMAPGILMLLAGTLALALPVPRRRNGEPTAAPMTEPERPVHA